ncbi:iron ABC transporter permease [Nocardioides sp. WV_118_6]|uniref:FecCD family ABC transporter permease n=1 Tax=Pimelobacter TaxID=2044 RepID=UPI00214FAFEC|nr:MULTISPECIES: iron ABC transporter permease [Pimelobacter]MBU2698405.1 iron ABC transporter permease [Pimelobacter sp. 30-1]UUW88963.1 iron ABC transporter permease [Pimelobacter simplex]UUW98468.1 iron ABC transporter permease [Pimelobacter simplex]
MTDAARGVRARARLSRPGGLVALLLLLLVVSFLSITQGSREIGLHDVVDALRHLGTVTTDDTVTVRLRVPRTILGVLVGAALGVAGAILQGLTRNALADPSIMGIEAGAALAVVLGITVAGLTAIEVHVVLAFVGALAATALVYGVGSLGRDGATPVKMALAGAAITAGLSAVTIGLLLTDLQAQNEFRFWQVGSLAGRYAPIVTGVAPVLLVALAIGVLCGRPLNALALGEDAARGLGISLTRTRIGLFAVVAVLCGAATAACGPIVFVGLVVPHVARAICGPDYRWILPYCLLLGPLLLLGADILGRILGSPGELQVGVVLGVLGAPFFIALVRSTRLAEL